MANFWGTSANNSMIGTIFSDVMVGMAGNDTIISAAGDDLVYGDYGGGEQTIPTLTGTLGEENCTFNDVLNTAAGNDTVDGQQGNDTIDAGAGDDHVYGGSGNDLITAGAGDDCISGDGSYYGGIDMIFVAGETRSSGNDTISAGAGNDFVSGDGGNDLISGDQGNDTIIGGCGSDTMQGGAGADMFVFHGWYYPLTDEGFGTNGLSNNGLEPGHDVITDFGKGDKIVLCDSVCNFQELQAFWHVVGLDVVLYDNNNPEAWSLTIKLGAVNHLGAGDFIFN